MLVKQAGVSIILLELMLIRKTLGTLVKLVGVYQGTRMDETLSHAFYFVPTEESLS